ncbi:hypothetical protein BDR03DRAFT_981340 [Suillus americanus]|nr:hypothetical protein BDR03DRAFT_981340 [Suillus americanus]
MSIPLTKRRMNPTTGVRIHKHNPKGVPCKNPQGGGLEDKSPWGQCGERGKKKEVAASATKSKPSAPPPPTPPAVPETATLATSSTHHHKWSSAAINELNPNAMPTEEKWLS